MKLTFSTLLWGLVVLTSYGQLWETDIVPNPGVLPPPNYESTLKGYDIRETNDGNYVFVGNHEYGTSTNATYTPTLAKLNATTGAIMWIKQYPSFNGGHMQELSLIEKPNGNLLVAGLNYDRIFLIETDPTGDTISTHQIISFCETLGGAGCMLRSVRLRATLDGNYIIGIGASGGLIGLPTPINQLIKISPTNTILWNKAFHHRFLLDFQPTLDGGYIMSGSTSTSQALLYKVDMNGDSLWEQTYNTIPVFDLHSVKETADSGFVVACFAHGFAGNNPFLFKTTGLGTPIWQIPLGGMIGEARHVVVTPDGDYVVTGTQKLPQSISTTLRDAIFVKKVSANGSVFQSQAFDELIDNSARAVRYTSDGNFIVVGSHGSVAGKQDRGYVVKTGYWLNVVEQVQENVSIEVFPNPLKEEATLEVKGETYEELTLQVVDALGRQVYQVTTNEMQIKLSKEQLKTGLYFFTLNSRQHKIGAGKIVVE